MSPSKVKLASPSKESVPLNIATLLSAPFVIDETEPPEPPENSIILPEESTPKVYAKVPVLLPEP